MIYKISVIQVHFFCLSISFINYFYYNIFLIQVCDYCDPTRYDKMHPPEFAVDGMETWWQSPPLSRGMKYNEVNLTIDLGQVNNSFINLLYLLYINLILKLRFKG